MRSGDNWENKIRMEILHSDIFYLFWSKAASESEYVRKEYEIALEGAGMC